MVRANGCLRKQQPGFRLIGFQMAGEKKALFFCSILTEKAGQFCFPKGKALLPVCDHRSLKSCLARPDCFNRFTALINLLESMNDFPALRQAEPGKVPM